MSTDEAPASAGDGCLAPVLFGGGVLMMFAVVSIGISYGSDDPLLLGYLGVLLLAPLVAWLGVARGHILRAALAYVGIVTIALVLGSTTG